MNVRYDKKKIAIGVDIQKNVIRYCLRKDGKWLYGEKLANGTFFKENGLKNQEELREVLSELFSDSGQRRPEVVIAVQNSKLLIRQIPLRNMETEKEIREFLYFELGDSIPLPFERPIFDLLILDRPSKKQRATENQKKEKTKTIKRNRFAVNGKVPVVVTSEPIIEELGTNIEKSGGRLIGVDCSALAYTRILRKKINWGQNFVFIELDAGAATITIFEKLVPVYVQYEEYNQVNWKYLEKSGVIRPEFRLHTEWGALASLGETIRNLIAYFEAELSTTSQLAQIYLVGGHPHLKQEVVKIIQKENELPVKVVSSNIKLTEKKRLPDRFLLAAGLALKEVR